MKNDGLWEGEIAAVPRMLTAQVSFQKGSSTVNSVTQLNAANCSP